MHHSFNETGWQYWVLNFFLFHHLHKNKQTTKKQQENKFIYFQQKLI